MNLGEELRSLVVVARETRDEKYKVDGNKWAKKLISKLPRQLRKEAKKGGSDFETSIPVYGMAKEVASKVLKEWAKENSLEFEFNRYSGRYDFRFSWY